MLIVFTIVIMLATAYAQYRNGLFTSISMLVMVLLSGLVAFNFWEPIAGALDSSFQDKALAGCEDLITLVLLFSVTLFLLRLATNFIAPDLIDEHGKLQYIGGGAVGLVTGYFVAGFLICAMETMPVDENFLGFEPRAANEPAFRALVPPDRVWLTMMRHAGALPFSWKEERGASSSATAVDRFETFDRNGTFELRYLRYRRMTEKRGPYPYRGEFDRDIGRKDR